MMTCFETPASVPVGARGRGGDGEGGGGRKGMRPLKKKRSFNFFFLTVV
jgi:hypothetical protein